MYLQKVNNQQGEDGGSNTKTNPCRYLPLLFE